MCVSTGLGMVAPNPAFTSMLTVFGLAGVVGEYELFKQNILFQVSFCVWTLLAMSKLQPLSLIHI